MKTHDPRRMALALILCFAAAVAAVAAPIEIPYESFTLDNGLTVVVHEDHKAPIVSVNIWYHVGSKNERPGKTGFAHLFEHLMFNGSENLDDDYFQLLERLGATDLNGTTNEDRTNYFQNVPTSGLDAVLWAESDRMGHLLGAVTQAKLDEQRGVVQNEKRQGENRPYGVTRQLIQQATYPAGHPYSWTVIGSMEDLDAAALEDVHQWFREYYGPSNAVLVISGDITPEVARAKVEKYFGDIPPGPPVARHDVWIAKRSGTQRQSVQDRVPQARLYMIWNVPPWGSAEHDYLELVADVLGSDKTSRLYQRLVYRDQLATTVRVYVASREIGSQFQIVATAAPGKDVAALEEAIDQELAAFLANGPTAQELDRAKTRFVADFVRGAERIGGFGGKSDVLARGATYVGDPGFYRVVLDRVDNAVANDLQTAAGWLADGVYILEVLPFPKLRASREGADRSTVPASSQPPEPRFPDFRRAKLANGLSVIVAERRATPLVEMSLLFDAGYAADFDAAPGTASFTIDMLDEGTASRDALGISAELARLGARFGAGSNLDLTYLELSSLSENLDASLDLFADLVLNPAFPEEEMERRRQQRIAAIQREKVDPSSAARRVLPKLLYGEDHPYGGSMTGTGTEASIAALTRDDLVAFHRSWFRPGNATLVVVGDVGPDELLPKVEAAFGAWEKGKTPRKALATVAPPPRPTIYIIDRPGSIQSLIYAGHVTLPKANPDELAIEAMNTILGGSFTSRINMNLREDKHWSYGSRSYVLDARGQRPFVVMAPVQTDRTKESIQELLLEVQGMRGDAPVTAGELEKVQQRETLRLAGTWETNEAVLGALIEMVRFGYPDDYYRTYAERMRKLTLDEVAAAATRVLHPEQMAWVVVGDRAVIEEGIRQLGVADVLLVDAEGNVATESGGAAAGR